MTKRRALKFMALVLALTMLLSSCVYYGRTDVEVNDDKPLKKMRIVLDWYPNAIHCFLYNAIEKGYFKDEGIELEILFPANPNDGISMPAAGKAELGIYYMKDVIKARADEGVPIRSIGALLQEPAVVMLSLKDKNITGALDLEGKKVGYAGMDLSKQTVIEMVKFAGGNPDSIEFVDVGFDLMNAMTTGQVDATIDCLENHEIPFMEKEGFEVNAFALTDYGIPNFYDMIIVTGDKTIEVDSDSIDAFMRAARKGFDDMVNDPEGSLAILFKNQNAENFPLDEAVEKQSLEILKSKMAHDGAAFLTQDAKVWQENIDWMKSLGFLEGDVKPEDLMYQGK